MKTHICFHGIGTCVSEREPGEARYWISEDLFLRVLDLVQHRPDAELSFDDGNKSDLEIALPALCARRLRASFYPLAGRLDDPVSLNAEALRELRANGMTIGSHGWHHVPWRGLSEADVQREFVDARSALEEACGTSITTAALPLGRYDRATLRQLKRVGYRAVFTSDRFPARPTSWLQARYSVTSDDTLESISQILEGRPGPREARNLMASALKRIR